MLHPGCLPYKRSACFYMNINGATSWSRKSVCCSAAQFVRGMIHQIISLQARGLWSLTAALSPDALHPAGHCLNSLLRDLFL